LQRQIELYACKVLARTFVVGVRAPECVQVDESEIGEPYFGAWRIEDIREDRSEFFTHPLVKVRARYARFLWSWGENGIRHESLHGLAHKRLPALERRALQHWTRRGEVNDPLIEYW
jgi:hypothetical protein